MSGGWGAGWGLSPWGGFLLPGGSSPPTPPTGWDIFLFWDVPDSMGSILTDPNVSSGGGSVEIDLYNDLCLSSGGDVVPPTTAWVFIDYPVPSTWTFQATATASVLPPDFSDLAHSHVYFGAADQTGLAAGLFVSQAGIAYAGSIAWDVDGNLELAGPFQVIPGTAGMITPGVQYTYRLAADSVTESVYVFVTESSLLEGPYPVSSQHLIAILPSIPSDGGFDGFRLSVCGTAARPSHVCFDMLGMATYLYMPDMPPRADAGRDQSLRMCNVGMLDGSASVDPEGGNITYSWRLIDAPVSSSFAFEGADGFTVPLPVPTGYADRLYSSQLGSEALLDPFVVGDVLLVAGVVHSVLEFGLDGNGYFARVASNSFTDSLAETTFKVLRQRFLANPLDVKPTFYADIPGIYKFDLVVFDGSLLSDPPSVTIVNVLESQVPKGCIPDLGFVWDYLSDFWKLVEDRERIQVVWESLAQVAAAELMTLWQIDYSKSLRDIQRTFQRRWLHYDLKLPEPLPDLTTITRKYGGVLSVVIPPLGMPGVDGTTLVIESPVHRDLQIPFQLAVMYTAAMLQQMLQVKLQGIDSRYSVVILTPRAGGASHLLIVAPFRFSIGAASTVPFFATGAKNSRASGVAGVRLTSKVYRVERSLVGLDIQEGDLLLVGVEGYKISRVVDDATDPLLYQRLVLQDELPIVPGAAWSIPSYVTSRLLNFYDGFISSGDPVVLEVTDSAQPGVVLLELPAAGACASEVTKLGVDVTSVDQYLSIPTASAQLAYVVRKTHVPVGGLVTDIPCLQEHIRAADDGAVLRRNIDFFLEQYRGQNSVRFSSGNPGDAGDVWEGASPPDRMWAEVTYFDNRPAIEANFGLPAEFTLDQLAELGTDLDYLSAVRGLWYSYLNGPTMHNLRVGSQILLGLPFAEEAGVIEEIRTDFSAARGRLLLRDSANTALVRSYYYPGQLELEVNPSTGRAYAVGDSVRQFAPLVQGVEVIDYVKNPRWFEGILHQGVFFEVEKFHRFMARVDGDVLGVSSTATLTALLFVRTFILRVKPTYTFPMFVVRHVIDKDAGNTTVDTSDDVLMHGRLVLNDGSCFNEWNYATMIDDWRAAGGRVRNQLDSNANPDDADPTFPTADVPVAWGLDKNYLCPEDYITASWLLAHAGGVIQLDTGYSIDASTSSAFRFETTDLFSVPTGAGFTFPGSYTAWLTDDLLTARVVIQGSLDPGDAGDYNLIVWLNGVDQPIPITVPVEGMVADIDLVAIIGSYEVAAGDVVTFSLASASAGTKTPSWVYVSVVLLQSEMAFQLDTGLPAGTYSHRKVL